MFAVTLCLQSVYLYVGFCVCLCIWYLNELCLLLKYLSSLHTLIMAYKWFKLLFVFSGPSWMLWPRLSPPASLYLENQTALLLLIHAWPSTRANTAFWSRASGAGGSWSCRKQWAYLTQPHRTQDQLLSTTFIDRIHCVGRKRLNYVNHARRLADGDWTGADSEDEEDERRRVSGSWRTAWMKKGWRSSRRKSYQNIMPTRCLKTHRQI